MKNTIVEKTRKAIQINNAVRPDHYRKGKTQPIEYIQEWNLNFCLGNVLKYISRAPYKGSELQDLNKAMEYLKREIQRVEKNG
tara:strand:- start:13484 stop:13732 length:249 start_codon:yes stop_codon:yes gene_type:complete